MAQIQRAQGPGQPGCVGIHMALASYYSKMKDLTKAEEYLDNALKLDPRNSEVLWLQAKVRRDKNLQQQTQKCKERFTPPKQEKLKMKDPFKVERCNHSNLSTKDFLYQYAMTGTPVIVTGLTAHMTSNPWSIQYIKKVIGHKKVPSNKQPTESPKSSGSLTVEQYINSLHDSKKPSCCSEWNLPSIAPELSNDLLIPRYVANDFLQRTEKNTPFRDAWLSLSIEPAGVVSNMQLEPFGLNCWMALFEGRKRLTFIRREDLPCLYPYCDENLNVVFNASISKPDLKDFPLLSTITPLECVLEPGEFLFIPSGTPYCVETLDDSLTVSGKYVDLSNLWSVTEEIMTMRMSDPKLQQLYEQLSSETFPTKMWSEQNDLKWQEFKQWPKENYQEFDISISDSP